MKYPNPSFTLVMLSLIVCLSVHSPAFAQEELSKTYVQIRVDGLSCPFCAYGLEKKLKKVDGVANIHILLEEGIVNLDVPTEKKPSEEDFKKVVTDAGFTPREITFSETPFKPVDDDL